MSEIDFPFHFDGRGRTAEAAPDEHLSDLIEQVLFTAPGERVNRPTFGSGVLELVFATNGDALAAASQLAVQGALQQWLGERIVVEGVDVASVDASLEVTVRFVDRRTQERSTSRFARESAR